MIGIKRTALAIYGLEKLDQEWILNNIPYDKRMHVVDAIDYIHRLSMKENNANITNLLTDNGVMANILKSDASKFMQVDLTPVAIINDILESEPDEIIHIILNYRDWSWKSEYIRDYSFYAMQDVGAVSGLDTSITEHVLRSVINKFTALVINYNSGEMLYD